MIYLYGASGHGLVVKNILMLNKIKVDRFIDDQPFLKKYGVEVIDLSQYYFSKSDRFSISIGNNAFRKDIAKRLNHVKYIDAIHPSAIISSGVSIGEGIVIGANAVINSEVVIGKHVIVNTLSCVEHESEIGDFVHISPGAVVCGNVKIGEGTHIGANSTIVPNINIGKWCIIGAGAVVIKDVPDNSMVIGVPGRIIKRNLFDEK